MWQSTRSITSSISKTNVDEMKVMNASNNNKKEPNHKKMLLNRVWKTY